MYRVHNIDKETYYDVKSWQDGKDNTDKSAIQECEKCRETIAMGKIIVEVVE